MIQATVSGNVGKDAETKTVGEDTVTSFSVASSKKVRDIDVTTWVDCSIWGKRGASLQPWLTKGLPVTVVGEMSTREYEGKNGKGFGISIRVSDIALQGGKKDVAASPPGIDTTGEIPF